MYLLYGTAPEAGFQAAPRQSQSVAKQLVVEPSNKSGVTAKAITVLRYDLLVLGMVH
jgi:hypothetical protein